MNEQPNNVVPIDKSKPTPTKFKIDATVDGYHVSLEFEGDVRRLRSVIAGLKSIGAVPATAPLAAAAQQPDAAPRCKYHGPMRMGKNGWFCPRKLQDGSGYCQEKA
jgi:hypothetical protein